MKGSLLVLALLVAGSAQAAPGEETLVVLVVDGKAVKSEPRMLDPTAVVLATSDWTSFGVVLPKGMAAKETITATELGVAVVYDSEAAELRLSIPAHLRPKQQLGRSRTLPQELSPAPRGVLIDYDVAAASDGEHHRVSVGHTARTGFAGGTLTSTGQVNLTSEQTDYIRGTTTWQRDNLSSGTSLSVGDVAAPSNGLNNTLLLGGVRIGTDRQLTRWRAGYEMPMIGGLADTRSTAEVFVNEHRRATGQLEPGPYELNPGLVVPGLNNLEVVQRDSFGREQSVSRSFYTHADLLRGGSQEWSLSAGAVRPSSIEDRYEGWALNGNASWGLSDRWTMGATVQAGERDGEGGRNLTLSNTVSLGRGGLLQAQTSVSQTDDGERGHAMRLGYERRTPDWSVSASHMRKSDDYWELSNLQGNPFTVGSQTTAAASIHPRGSQWRGSVSYTDIDYTRSRVRQVAATATYRQPSASWIFGGIHDLGTGDNQVYVGVRMNNSRRGQTSYTARSAPFFGPQLEASYSGGSQVAGRDFRYQVAGTAGEQWQAYGRMDTTLAGGDFSVEARKAAQQPALVNARYHNSVWVGEGGLLNGRGHAPYQSFAVVEVPGQAAMDVRGGRPAPLKTNKSGYALLTGLPSLTATMVAIDPLQLPLDHQLENHQQQATPARNGGAKVVFPITEHTQRQYEVRMGDGWAPENARATSDQGEAFLLGSRGVLVLEQKAMTAVVELKDGNCELVLPEQGGVVQCIP